MPYVFEKVAQICVSIFLSLKLGKNISGYCEVTLLLFWHGIATCRDDTRNSQRTELWKKGWLTLWTLGHTYQSHNHLAKIAIYTTFEKGISLCNYKIPTKAQKTKQTSQKFSNIKRNPILNNRTGWNLNKDTKSQMNSRNINNRCFLGDK